MAYLCITVGMIFKIRFDTFQEGVFSNILCYHVNNGAALLIGYSIEYLVP